MTEVVRLQWLLQANADDAMDVAEQFSALRDEILGDAAEYAAAARAVEADPAAFGLSSEG